MWEDVFFSVYISALDCPDWPVFSTLTHLSHTALVPDILVMSLQSLSSLSEPGWPPLHSQQQQCMPSYSASSAILKRTTKRKTESSPLENIIGPVLKCTHSLPRTVYTNTDEVLLSSCEKLLNYNIFPSASRWEGVLGSGGGLRTGALTSGFWMKGIIKGSSAKGRAGALWIPGIWSRRAVTHEADWVCH